MPCISMNQATVLTTSSIQETITIPGRPHPDHAGDLLPLMGNQGYAWSAFYDKRFTLDEIIGRSVIIHSGRDDFSSQPSGDSGTKIGCGTIKRAI